MKLFSLLFIVMTFIISGFGQADAVDKYFKDYQENANFSTVYVSPKMFQMITKASESQDPDVKDVLKDLKGLKILSTKVKPEQTYSEANRRITNKGYEELLTVKEKGSLVRFVTLEKSGIIEELLMLVGNKEDFIMISFIGKINLSKLSKLAKKLDIQGAEHLDKINKK
ncbi:MAG: DUF4252 domain-containing protein [Saprospiraceae bacterium]|nr:DUF4252 domain-containing protein [Saprospiraceae bacterium]MBK6783409.1 DUF4252 domain-containing protein [Saprospiraceae bacterium]MBK7524315.1 DUF4252 domain-containing protein [Saprospiraceae bacterium]MBK8372763.1 DUF4252 domain-containing protein [Saprospiraceae bacterium]MBK8549110.1 DUF4252 domain-containing protein [Saprospiraceae bacterium]